VERDNFKAAFTAAGSWGTFRQRRLPGSMEARIKVEFQAAVIIRKLEELRIEIRSRFFSLRVKPADAP
jgi:hypothetical protein